MTPEERRITIARIIWINIRGRDSERDWEFYFAQPNHGGIIQPYLDAADAVIASGLVER